MQRGNVGMHGSEARGKLKLTSMAVCRLVTMNENLARRDVRRGVFPRRGSTESRKKVRNDSHIISSPLLSTNGIGSGVVNEKDSHLPRNLPLMNVESLLQALMVNKFLDTRSE